MAHHPIHTPFFSLVLFTHILVLMQTNRLYIKEIELIIIQEKQKKKVNTIPSRLLNSDVSNFYKSLA